MSHGFTTQRQFQAAQLLQSLLLVLGVLFLGAGFGYFMALSAVAGTECSAAFAAPDVCSPIVADLNSGMAWSLGLGVLTLAASALMSYGLRRVEL